MEMTTKTRVTVAMKIAVMKTTTKMMKTETLKKEAESYKGMILRWKQSDHVVKEKFIIWNGTITSDYINPFHITPN
jgi:hypothetical protein